MRNLSQLLVALLRPDVGELALSAGRLPCVKQAGAYVPISQAAIDEAPLLEFLRQLSGSAQLDALGERPVSWTHVERGVGIVALMAVRRGGVVQARITLKEREAGPVAAAPQAGPPARPAPAAPMPAPAAGRVPAERASASHLDAPLELGLDVADAKRAAPAAPPVPDRGGNEVVPAAVGGGLALELDLDVARPEPKAALPAAGPRFSVDEPAAGAGAAAPPAPPAPPAADAHPRPARAALPDGLAELLGAARKKSATDVHVVADRLATFRIGGGLVAQSGYIAAREVEAMLLPIVPPHLVETLARTGSADFAVDDAKLGRFRVNVARQRTGLKGCFRLISTSIPDLATLGLPPSVVDATHHHQGLVLITGPTGSGKSTTLAAIVAILNRETSHHVITVEDPIEHLHAPAKALLTQREVGAHTRSFAAALKASLREDPDVIVVGELRDAETVRMALTASETGHLVIATMNTPSAAKTIDRLIDVFPPADQAQVRTSLAGGLRLILGQRLVPTLHGGLVAACEMLPGCVPLWSLIREGRTFQIPSLQQRGKQLGIVRLDDQLTDMVRGGRISMEAARFVAESPDFGGAAK